MEKPEALCLPLRWSALDGNGDMSLTAGSIQVGEVFCGGQASDWWARGKNFCTHRSRGHSSCEAAQAALIADLMKFATYIH